MTELSTNKRAHWQKSKSNPKSKSHPRPPPQTSPGSLDLSFVFAQSHIKNALRWALGTYPWQPSAPLRYATIFENTVSASDNSDPKRKRNKRKPPQKIVTTSSSAGFEFFAFQVQFWSSLRVSTPFRFLQVSTGRMCRVQQQQPGLSNGAYYIVTLPCSSTLYVSG